MKVTFFVGGLSGGGAQRVICNLSDYLIRAGHYVEILTINSTCAYELNRKVKRYVIDEKNVCGYNKLKKKLSYLSV